MKTGARNFQQGQSETYDYKTLMFRSRLDSIRGKKTIEMLMLFKDRNKKKNIQNLVCKKKNLWKQTSWATIAALFE